MRSQRRKRVLALLATTCAFPALPAPMALHAASPRQAASPAPGPAWQAPLFGPDSLEKLAQKAVPAVVRIDVHTARDSRQGSGFLVDPSGVILTNYHVIRDAQSARVKLADGDVYDHVSVLAMDQRRDIAVLRVDGYGLPTLSLGNSDSVHVGAPLIVIGSPLGLENTVSTGIVSGHRKEPAGYQLIQITAPASPGSSGGPVLSLDGTVIGIAVSQMRSGQNLNFAVPINYARGLLSHVGEQPVATLGPGDDGGGASGSPLATGGRAVNRGLPFDLGDLRGYTVERREEMPDGQLRRTRVTYRRIQTIGSSEPRVERYVESETTRKTGPFHTREVVRRERSRTISLADGLRPLYARGEVEWWTDRQWSHTTYDLSFSGDHVKGSVTDTAGSRRELDRDLPSGIVLRQMRDLAFASMAGDSLVGRSVDLTTFDPQTGETSTDRFDVRGVTKLKVLGQATRALRVEMASGLSNVTLYFDLQAPHVLVREEGERGVTELDELSQPPEPPADSSATTPGGSGRTPGSRGTP